MILNHFLMRRIGFETVNAFCIQLNVKLNEIMPLYNKMWDSLENWDIFQDGEVTSREGYDNTKNSNNTTNTLSNNSTTNSSNTSDNRYSDTPQNQLGNVQDGKYITDYTYNQQSVNTTDNSTSNGTTNSTGNSDKTYKETVTRSPSDKITILKEMQTNVQNIYSMIFKDLECLFYQILN